MSSVAAEQIPTRFSMGAAGGRTCDSRPGSLVRIYAAEGLGQLISLSDGSVLVGRDPAAQLSIDDDSVSRRHALLEHMRGVDVVQDLGSTDGTWVNEQKISVWTLEAGDRLRFGKQIFTYLSGSSLEAQYHESVYRMMTTDGLTQAHNRRFLLDALEREVSRARRRQSSVSVLMMDIDRFKAVNDTWGHLAGDAVLVEFVKRAGSILQGGETLARFGGEEFALLLPDTSLSEAAQIAENIRAAVSLAPVRFEAQEIPLTVSIGVAELTACRVTTVSALLEAADQMLYLAKSSGRNQVKFSRS
jgi:diguanylate cyclase (GGDEF)-like protein